MNRKIIPYCTIFIALATFIYSLFVCYSINDAFFGKTKIPLLEEYGGVTFEHLKNHEYWRIFASQMIHSRQLHMLYSVLSLLALGFYVERHLSFSQFFILYFVSGTVGTLISTLTVNPPWNLGTGASQAIFGVAAFGMILAAKRMEVSKTFYVALVFAILPAITLDLIYAGYPKLGHVTGFVTGGVIGLIYLWFKNPDSIGSSRLRSS